VEDIRTLTVHGALEALEGGSCSSEELVRALLGAIEEVDGDVAAYLTVDSEDALAQARVADAARAAGGSGRLLGVPIAIKDVLNVEGQPCTCASRILQGYVSPYDATAVARLRAEGAVFVGRTNMDEFAMGSTTENSAYKPTRNPANLDYVPGGSSGGSAAAVAAGEALASLGSDTGGSIRQPAAFCGCVGLKPSYGRVSRYGLTAFASSLDQVGPLTRTVSDAALLLEVTGGRDPLDSSSIEAPLPSVAEWKRADLKGVRLGLPKEYFVEGMDADVEAAVRGAVETCRELGAEVVDVSLPHTEYAIAAYYIIATAEASANLARFDGVRYGWRAEGARDPIDMYGKTRAQGFGAEVKRRIILGTYVLSSGYHDAYYLSAQKVRTLIRRDFEAAFEQCDALLTPVTPTPAYRQGETTDDPLQMYLGDIFTVPANLAGICGLSVPCGATASHVHAPRDLVSRGAWTWRQWLSSHRPADPGGRIRGGECVAGRIRVRGGRRDGMNYLTTIGLEVHVQLKTAAKKFCGCSTLYGSEPNTQVCPVCLGYPGAMPVMNAEAIRLTVTSGLTIGSTISSYSKFDRKSYFYPDMPKNYQISQYDKPLCEGGSVEIEVDGETRRIGIARIHLEEDVGKSMHFHATSGVDFNRAGLPLMEIVSEPDLTSPEEAFAFLTALKQILLYAGVSDCNLECGNVRCDVNVSVRPEGQVALGTKTEIKNMNTFRGVLNALKYEIGRQVGVLESGGSIVQETRRWDVDSGITAGMRTKEDAHDYRYFPEPDLMPVVLSSETVEEWRGALPELPAQKRERFVREYGIPEYDAGVLAADRRVADFYEAAARDSANPKGVSNWMMTEMLRLLSEREMKISDVIFSPRALTELVKLVDDKAINSTSAKEVFAELFEKGGLPGDIVRARGLTQVSDSGAIETLVDQAMAENPGPVEDYRSGKKAAAKFLVGQVMRLSKGKANPQVVTGLLERKLKGD